MSTSLPSRHRHRLPLAAAAAGMALALALGGVAYATGSIVSIPQFASHLFGGSEAKVEVVGKVGRPVGVSQSVGGVTVSADAIIGDKTNVAIVFSVSKDDGTPFEGIEALDNGLLMAGFSGENDLDVDFPLLASPSGATGGSYFYDADPADNAIQLVETRSYDTEGSDVSLVGRTATARFHDLARYDEDGSTVIAPGDWTLTFPLDYEDASVELPAGQAIELAAFYEDDAAQTREEIGAIQATIDELALSPIALHVRYTAQHEVEWTSGESGRESEHDSRLSSALLSLRATVTLRDGSSFELDNYGSGAISSGEDVAHCETSVVFDRIIDLDEVASITIGGTTIGL